MTAASGTGRDADVFSVEHQKQGLPINAEKAQVQCLTWIENGRAVCMDNISVSILFQGVCQRHIKTLLKRRNPDTIFMKTLGGDFTGCTKAYYTGNIFCSATESEFLLRTAKDDGCQHTFFFGEQCSDTFWPVNFMRRNREEIAPDFLHINWMTASA